MVKKSVLLGEQALEGEGVQNQKQSVSTSSAHEVEMSYIPSSMHTSKHVGLHFQQTQKFSTSNLCTNLRDYDTLLDTYSFHHIMIKKGRTITSTPEFESYARTFKWRWTQIMATLLCFEGFAVENSVDLLFLDGKKLVELSMREEFLNNFGTGDVLEYWRNNEKSICNANYQGSLRSQSSLKSFPQMNFSHRFSYRLLTKSSFISQFLLPCIVNTNDLQDLLNEVGLYKHLYSCRHRAENAAILIQSFVRMFLAKCKYNMISKKAASAMLIQRHYRAYKYRKKFSQKMEMLRKERVKGLEEGAFLYVHINN
jgi:hypothetical protein